VETPAAPIRLMPTTYQARDEPTNQRLRGNEPLQAYGRNLYESCVPRYVKYSRSTAVGWPLLGPSQQRSASSPKIIHRHSNCCGPWYACPLARRFMNMTHVIFGTAARSLGSRGVRSNTAGNREPFGDTDKPLALSLGTRGIKKRCQFLGGLGRDRSVSQIPSLRPIHSRVVLLHLDVIGFADARQTASSDLVKP
jgi:hypothetical protein